MNTLKGKGIYDYVRNLIKEKSVIFQREKDEFVRNVAVECVV